MKLTKIFDRKVFDPTFFLWGGVLLPLYAVIWCAMHFDAKSLLTLYAVVLLGGLNISLFAHRCWTHRAWRPVRWLNLLGLFLHTVQLAGNHIAWVATHRKHHRLEDTPEDPHSPYFMPRWKVIFWAEWTKIDLSYATDLMRDKDHLFFVKYYWHINIAWWILLFAINPAALAFWVAFIGAAGCKMRLINSIGHADPVNKSTNNRPIWALIYLDGEPWHDNHSKHPRDWEFGKTWYQVDFGKYCIKAFEKLGCGKINYV